MSRSVPDSRVWVVGAGLQGCAIALELAGCGAAIAVCGRRPDPIAAVKADIETAGGTCFAMPCDIRDAQQIAAFVSATKAALGSIDILVNNAGGQRAFLAADMPLTNFEKVVQNNLVGTFAMTQAVAQQAMIPQKRGSIVNIIAMILRGFPGMVHTGAARAGVDNMTKSLAVEWSPDRIRVNAVAPGTVLPPPSAGEAQQAAMAERTLLGRWFAQGAKTTD